jgi:phosphatidylglycerophosphate synthase
VKGGRALAIDRRLALKSPDAWWTVLVVDPIALRILPALVPRQRITPDRLSVLSGLLSILAGFGFLAGWYLPAGIVFEVAFVIDCLDGKLARLRHIQNPRGGFLDLACDLIGTGWCYAALGASVFRHTQWSVIALLPALLYTTYTWSTLHRSRAGGLDPGRPRRGIAGWMVTHRLVTTPYGVEVETLSLFILPLTGCSPAMRIGLVIGGAFYALATLRNLKATYRVTPVRTASEPPAAS